MSTTIRVLPLVVLIGTFAVGHSASAQDGAAPKPPYTAEAMLRRIAAASAQTPAATDCVRAVKERHAVNATVRVAGRTYRCLQILDQDFQPRGVSWTLLPTYTSEAMLRRIGGGSIPPGGAASSATCRLPDRTERTVDATVTVEGRTYRCVEVLDENLQPRGAGWTPVPQPFF